MRKVLSIVLVLALVLGSTAFTFGAVPSDVSGTKYEDAVNVLMELDVISGYPDGSYKPAGIVTRGEMAKIIICALGLEDYAAGASSFKDMAGHWSDKYVAYAASLGIINGYPDGTFKPDNTVSYDEAAKMLVAALGYTEDALIGTWPGNWVTKAKVLDIIKGVQSGPAGANRGDIALMTFETLDEEMGKVNKDGVFVTHFTETGDSDTMLTRLGAELYDPAGDAYDPTVWSVGAEFVVTGEEDSIISLKELQGALVTAYANDENEIIAIKEVLSTFITDEFTDVVSAGDIDATDKFGDYKVKANFEIASALTAGLTHEFVNGASTGNTVDTAGIVTGGDEYTIAAKISGNYITKIYSIASWDAAAPNGAADMIDEDDLEDIEDGELFGFEFKQTNKDEIDLDSFALFGIDNLDDLEEDHVVYVYNDGTTATEYISRIDVGTEVAEGVISKMTSNKLKITIGGKEYKMSDYVAAADFTALGDGAKVGDTVALYLDYFGKAFDLEIIDGEKDLLAVVVDYYVDPPANMKDPDEEIKLFLADGTVKPFDFNSDLLDTGAAFTNLFVDPAKGATGAAGKIDVGSVVEYSLDKNGKINGIAFKAATHDVAGEDLTSKGIFDDKYVATDAIIFTTEGTGFVQASDDTERVGTKDSEWGVTTLEKAKGLEGLDAYYEYDGTMKKITWMVIKGGSTSEDVLAMYNGHAEVDTDAGYEVYAMVDGKEVEYEADAQTKAQPNDGATPPVYDAIGTMKLYIVKFASDGTISSWTAVTTNADYDEKTFVANSIDTANKVTNNVLTVAAGGADDNDYTLDKDILIYVYDADEDMWVKGAKSAFNSADYSDLVLIRTDKDGQWDIALIK